MSGNESMHEWRYTDVLTDAEVVLSYGADGGGELVVSRDDGSVAFKVTIDLTAEHFAAMLRDVVAHAAAEHEREEAETLVSARKREQREQTERDAAPFRVTERRSGKTVTCTVHLRNCVNAGGTLLTLNGAWERWRLEMQRMRAALSDSRIASWRRQVGAAVGKGRKMPSPGAVTVRFCLHCRPLGDVTRSASDTQERLNQYGMTGPDRFEVLDSLNASVLDALSEAERRHVVEMTR